MQIEESDKQRPVSQKQVRKVATIISLTRGTQTLEFILHLWTKYAGLKKTTHTDQKAGVSQCLVPPTLIFQTCFQRETEFCMETERGLCGLYISQSPHSIYTHSSPPACACRLPVSKHLLRRQRILLLVSTQMQTY